MAEPYVKDRYLIRATGRVSGDLVFLAAWNYPGHWTDDIRRARYFMSLLEAEETLKHFKYNDPHIIYVDMDGVNHVCGEAKAEAPIMDESMQAARERLAQIEKRKSEADSTLYIHTSTFNHNSAAGSDIEWLHYIVTGLLDGKSIDTLMKEDD